MNNMAKIDETYHKLLNEIIKKGFRYEDPNRKGVYRYQIPRYEFIHNFKDGFPAITTKKLHWKSVVAELLWFLRGDTNIKYLVDNGVNIWNKDAYNWYLKQIGKNNEGKYYLEPMGMNTFLERIKDNKNYEKSKVESHDYKLGDLGRVYGAQWRQWRYIANVNMANFSESHYIGLDQISNLIQNLKEKPLATNHIVTAWNPAELNNMALPPCHWSFEILVEPLKLMQRKSLWKKDNYYKEMMFKDHSNERCIDDMTNDNVPLYQFTLKWHQRSVDSFLGLPFNIASYALLAQIIGKMTNMVPKGIIGDLINVHIYEPHMDAVKEQLSRSVNIYNSKCDLIMPELNKKACESGGIDKILDLVEIDSFNLTKHFSQPAIKAEMLPYNN